MGLLLGFDGCQVGREYLSHRLLLQEGSPQDIASLAAQTAGRCCVQPSETQTSSSSSLGIWGRSAPVWVTPWGDAGPDHQPIEPIDIIKSGGGVRLRLSAWCWGTQRPRLVHLCDAHGVAARVSESGEGATTESVGQILCIPDARDARLSGRHRSSYTSRFCAGAYCSINPPLDRISRSARRR